MAKLNSQIDEQRTRKERAEAASRRIDELLNEVTGTLRKLCEKFQVRVINYKSVNVRDSRAGGRGIGLTEMRMMRPHLISHRKRIFIACS